MIKTLTRPRIFYRTYLAQYWIFQQLKKLLLLVYFRFPRIITRISFLFRKVETFNLIPMRDFKTQQDLESIQIEPSKQIEIPGPKFIGSYPIDLGHNASVQLDTPCLEIVKISRVILVGGTSWIFKNKFAVYPDLLIPSRDITLAEVYGGASVNVEKNQLHIPLRKKSRKISAAVSLLGQCTGNYAHWLTESLPKLFIIDSISEYGDLPLLVDEWVHPNCYEQLDFFNKKKRQIITVGRWEIVSVACLIEISPPAYLSHESREYLVKNCLPKPQPDLFPFSKSALEMLRHAAHELVSSYKEVSRRKLYLRRAPESVGNGRFIINIEEVEHLIANSGFETIDPAKLNVIEQMIIFRDAGIVISPVGAALANTIFSQPGCKIIALAPYYKNASYYYFSNLMSMLGHDLYYVLGPQVEMNAHVFHRNYSINIAALEEALIKLAG